MQSSRSPVDTAWTLQQAAHASPSTPGSVFSLQSIDCSRTGAQLPGWFLKSSGSLDSERCSSPRADGGLAVNPSETRADQISQHKARTKDVAVCKLSSCGAASYTARANRHIVDLSGLNPGAVTCPCSTSWYTAKATRLSHLT